MRRLVILVLALAGCASHAPRDTWHRLLGPNRCAAQPDENACMTCIRASCCAEVYQCESSAGCKCYFPCRLSGLSRETCAWQCQTGREVPSYSNELASCTNDRCAIPCSEVSWF